MSSISEIRPKNPATAVSKTSTPSTKNLNEIPLEYLVKNVWRPHEFSPELTQEFSKLPPMTAPSYQCVPLTPSHPEFDLVFAMLRELPPPIKVTNICTVNNPLLSKQFEAGLNEMEETSYLKEFHNPLDQSNTLYEKRVKIWDEFKKKQRPFSVEAKEPYKKKLMNVKVIFGCYSTTADKAKILNTQGFTRGGANPGAKDIFTGAGEGLLGAGHSFVTSVLYAVNLLERKKFPSSTVMLCAVSYIDPFFPVVGDTKMTLCSDVKKLFGKGSLEGFNAHLGRFKVSQGSSPSIDELAFETEKYDYNKITVFNEKQVLPFICLEIQKVEQAIKELPPFFENTPQWFFKNIEGRAKNRSPRDLFLLGLCHQIGFGTTEDKAKAFAIYKDAQHRTSEDMAKARARNEPQPQIHIHPHLFYTLAGFEVNQTNAIKLYTLAAEAGDIKSQLYLGKHYKQVTDMYRKEIANLKQTNANQNEIDSVIKLAKENYDHSYKYLLLAANNNSPEGQYSLGVFFEEGKYAQMDKALSWYTKSARQGYAPSLFKLGVHYLKEMDFKQAQRYLYHAAILNYPPALHLMGMHALNGECDSEKNPKKAFEYLKQAAHLGYMASHFQVGQLLYEASSGTYSAECLGHLTQAAEDGNGEAAYLVAQIYKSLNYSKQYQNFLEKTVASGCQSTALAKSELALSFIKTKEYTKAEAFLNPNDTHAKNQYLLGIIHEEGIKIDLAKAEEYYMKASKGDYLEAQTRLNYLFVKKMNPGKLSLFKIFTQSALEGKEDSYYQLGKLFAEIPELDKAIFNYKFAAAKGHHSALKELVSLEQSQLSQKHDRLKMLIEEIYQGKKVSLDQLGKLFDELGLKDKANSYYTFAKYCNSKNI